MTPPTEPAEQPGTITWFRYVVHARVAEFRAAGWRLADDLAGTNHGRWAVLMQWPHASAPPRT